MQSGLCCTLKSLLCTFVALFCTFGAASFLFGIHLRKVYSAYNAFLGLDFRIIATVFTVVGSVCVIISIIAFFDAIVSKCHFLRFHPCLPFALLALMAFAVLCELAAGVSASYVHLRVRDVLEAQMTASLSFYQGGANATSWDEMQAANKCCGVRDYADWLKTPFGEGQNVPDSCCTVVGLSCGRSVGRSREIEQAIFIDGCLAPLTSRVQGVTAPFIAGTACLAFTHLSGIVGMLTCTTYKYRYELLE